MTEKITSISPEVGETTEAPQTNDETPSNWDGVPETIQACLYNSPVLPHENEDSFFALFDSYRNYFKPKNIIDFDLVYTITVCKWEINRYRSMAIAATSNQQQAGLESLFARTHEAALLKGAENGVAIEAASKARKVLTNADYREEAYFELESYGHIPDSQAFLLSLPSLREIERLLTSAEKRYAASLKELEKRKE